MSTQGILGNFGCPFFCVLAAFGPTMLWVFFCEYPFLRVLRLAVPLLQRLTFPNAEK